MTVLGGGPGKQRVGTGRVGKGLEWPSFVQLVRVLPLVSHSPAFLRWPSVPPAILEFQVLVFLTWAFSLIGRVRYQFIVRGNILPSSLGGGLVLEPPLLEDSSDHRGLGSWDLGRPGGS